jgi:hypothetical protein
MLRHGASVFINPIPILLRSLCNLSSVTCGFLSAAIAGAVGSSYPGVDLPRATVMHCSLIVLCEHLMSATQLQVPSESRCLAGDSSGRARTCTLDVSAYKHTRAPCGFLQPETYCILVADAVCVRLRSPYCAHPAVAVGACAPPKRPSKQSIDFCCR